MAPNNLKKVETDKSGVGRSVSDDTVVDSHYTYGGAVTGCLVSASRCNTVYHFNHKVLSGMKSSVPKVLTTRSTRCALPSLEGVKRSTDSGSRIIAESNDGDWKKDSKQNHSNAKQNDKKRYLWRRQRKGLIFRESFFLDEHQELLFRYGPEYRDFVIPCKPQPKQMVNAPAKAQRKQTRKHSKRELPLTTKPSSSFRAWTDMKSKR